ncbi:hypothetical protein [Bartonella sp. AC535YNZD]|uniref:hypothetical protein n=1 Tax=Bartonella sp. AC535YNZD TaxID=3243455 RepID=UPI0035D05F52
MAGGVLLYFWSFPPFEGSAVLRRFRSRPFFSSCGDGEYGHTMGTIVLDGAGVCCIVGVVFDFAYEGVARWGGDALFVVIEGGGAVVGASFFCLHLGVENLGLRGLWFAKDWVFFVICGLILPVVSMGAGRVRVKAVAFLKRVGFVGYYR